MGLIEQSFCGSLQEELTEYYRLVAVLESQVVAAMGKDASEWEETWRCTTRSTTTDMIGLIYPRMMSILADSLSCCHVWMPYLAAGSAPPFTLRRLYVWILDPLERLRLMATLVDAIVGLKGGSLASAIGAHVQHGDPFVITFVRKIMRKVRT